jgi:hypothetical protein
MATNGYKADHEEVFDISLLDSPDLRAARMDDRQQPNNAPREVSFLFE